MQNVELIKQIVQTKKELRDWAAQEFDRWEKFANEMLMANELNEWEAGTAEEIVEDELTEMSKKFGANLRHESEFDPVLCPMSELEEEIAKIGRRAGDKNLLRGHFLQGIRHTRIIIAAGTGGRIR